VSLGVPAITEMALSRVPSGLLANLTLGLLPACPSYGKKPGAS
jgi:hypothetical protein